MDRVINFNAGPSPMPLEVLKRAKDEFLDYKGLGLSVMEMSHRTPEFEEIVNSAKRKIKAFYSLSDDYEVLFLQGGGTLQFAQIPMNLYKGGVAEYVHTGVWTKKAMKEAEILGINYKVVASSESSNFDEIPSSFSFSDDADYAYICSNNTIYGTQYKTLPKTKAPLVIDASSDLFSKPLELDGVGIYYGGAQKNAGPSGVTVVVIRRDLSERAPKNVPSVLRYDTMIANNSMLNTPNTFGIYMLDLMLDWISENGGLEGINARNEQKATTLYACIDELSEFYKGHAKKDSRSLMNATFNIADKELEAKFVSEAKANGMIGLKGHRLVGGIRTSIYNAVTLKSVETLCEFMREFARKNG